MANNGQYTPLPHPEGRDERNQSARAPRLLPIPSFSTDASSARIPNGEYAYSKWNANEESTAPIDASHNPITSSSLLQPPKLYHESWRTSQEDTSGYNYDNPFSDPGPSTSTENEDVDIAGSRVLDESIVYGDQSFTSGYLRDPAAYTRQRSHSPDPDGSFEHVGNDTLDYLSQEHLYLQSHSNHRTLPAAEPVGSSTQHYGPAPKGPVTRRHKTLKRIALTNGHLITELEVPNSMSVPVHAHEETRSTRYSCVTCDPDDFEAKGFFLRQNSYGRRTELFIAVTMYNEDHVLLTRTLYGIMKNIAHLCSRKNSSTWGSDSWQKVVVCIIADGRRNVHPRVLDILTVLGVYQAGGHMKNFVNDEPVQAHLFEYTTTFALDPELKFRFPGKGIVPTQILFCLKEKNQRKINSHRWFFNAFARLLQPNVCILLDVGTRPEQKSLYHLWKAFDLNSNVGGACGEVAVYKGPRWTGLLNPLVAAQNFEYKMSNILDKTTESVFGYINVLPGAFSAYRWIALQNDSFGIGPLASYFKGEVLNGRETDLLTSNMYLAEDRILCFELVAKTKSSWLLKYVKSAVGTTDVPESLAEFISQRRRWLNGSFFAAVYALAHVGQIMRSDHGVWRKIVLLFEAGYNALGLAFAWFAVGNYYIFFVILTSSFNSKSKFLSLFNSVMQYTYIAALIACFLFSMGNKPQASSAKYTSVASVFAVLTVYMLGYAIVCLVRATKHVGSTEYNQMLLSLLATYISYVAASLLALEPWHLATSFWQYTLLTATYVNVLNVFAFCNLDDISWGTKQEHRVMDVDLGAVVQDSQFRVDLEVESSSAEAYAQALRNIKLRQPTRTKVPTAGEQQQAAKDYYANVRTNVLFAWIITNGVLVLSVLNGSDLPGTIGGTSPASSKPRLYTVFVLSFVALMSITRLLGAIVYFCIWILTG